MTEPTFDRLQDLSELGSIADSDVLPVARQNGVLRKIRAATLKNFIIDFASTLFVGIRSVNGKQGQNITLGPLDVGAVPSAALAVPYGVATLDFNGKVPYSQIPKIAISETFVVDGESEMVGLSQAEIGDIAVRTDEDRSYILTSSNYSSVDSWVAISVPSGAVTSVNGQTGAISVDKASVGLGSVQNIAPADMPISLAVQTALSEKASTDFVNGKVVNSLGSSTSSAPSQAAVQTAVSSLESRIGNVENPLLISSFGASPSVAETGSTQTVSLSWGLSKTPASQYIDQGVGSFGAAARNATVYPISSDRTWTLTVSDGSNNKTAAASISFQRRRYYGITSKPPGVALTNSEVLAMAKEFSSSRVRNGMLFNCTGGRYPTVIYPASFGAPSAVRVGGFTSTDYTVEYATIVNDSADSASYVLIRLNTIQNGSAIQIDIA